MSGIKAPYECGCWENTTNSGILKQESVRITWGSFLRIASQALSALNSVGLGWRPVICILTSTSGGSDAAGPWITLGKIPF